MKSSDWQPMATAPLNPYGKGWGPTILVWCSADNNPVAAYFEPTGSDDDNKPRWVCADDGQEMRLEDAAAWMPIAAPWPETSAPLTTVLHLNIIENDICKSVAAEYTLTASIPAMIETAKMAERERCAKAFKSNCPKCGGEGWLWAGELDETPDYPAGMTDDTKYSCDGEICKIAAAIRGETK